MVLCSTRLLSVCLASFAASAAIAQITPGNLVVTRVGDGSAALTSAAAAVFLDEYTPAGVLVQSIPMPTVGSGANHAIVNSGSATSEGSITQSADGRYLVTVGYDAAPGTTGVTGTTGATNPRIIARIALDGTIDTSTAIADAYSGSNIRGACSIDGEQFWTAGTASAANGPGVRYVAALGDTTSVQLSTSVTNIRRVETFGGQLYCSTASGAFLGVSTVGTGLPTASGETVTLLPGFPVASASAYDFWFADAETLYVTDDRTNGNGGLQKWTLSGGSWTLQYLLADAANIGCRGVSGFVEGGVATLFATTTDSRLVTVTDTGAGSPFSTLNTAASNTAMRSVRWVRTPTAQVHSGTDCANTLGTPVVGTNSLAVAGNTNFRITGSDVGAGSITIFVLSLSNPLPFGIPIPGAPSCAFLWASPDVLTVEVADGAGVASTPIGLPNNASLGGATLGTQVVAFDLSLAGSYALPVGTSDALGITVGN